MTTMTCQDVLERIEAIAAGDVEVEPPLRSHLETCPRCAAALAAARRLEQALSGLDVPSAPATFTATVLARVRRERWQSEQHVDRLFNVAVAVATVLVVGGAFALLNVNAVAAAGRLGWTALSALGETAVAQVGPAVPTYVAAAGLLASALGMWWWADRRVSL